MNRLVCWVGFLSLKEKFSFRDAGSTTQNPAQTPTALLDTVTDAAVTQWLLGTNSARTTKRVPSRWASAIQIVREYWD
jgi:hypothetical protein